MDLMCRTCMRSFTTLLPLSADNSLKIQMLTSIQIGVDDENFPSHICEECVNNLNSFYNFRIVIINNDLDFRDRLYALSTNPSDICDESVSVLDPNCNIKNEAFKSISADTDFNCVSLNSEVIIKDEDFNTEFEEDWDIAKEFQIKNDISNELKVDNNPNICSSPTTNYGEGDINSFETKIYGCRQCSLTFENETERDKHRRDTHKTYRICNFCGKSINSRLLSIHVKTHEVEPAICPVCGKKYKNAGSLKFHMLLHKEEEESACEICRKTFPCRRQYQSHMRNHYESESNPDRDFVPSTTDSETDSEGPALQNQLVKNLSNDSQIPIGKLAIPYKRKKHVCFYCDTPVNNFARHIKRQHCEEIEVRQFLSLEKSDPKRKQLIDKIRKEGDFRSGQLVPVHSRKRKFITENIEDNEDEWTRCELLPCTYCRGFYSRDTLRRHVRRCPLNTNINTCKRTYYQSTGHTLMANDFGPDDPLLTTGLLDSLSADEVSLVAKRDETICEVARKHIESHKGENLILVAKRYMRRLARLLMEVRNIEEDKTLTLSSILHPSKIKVIIAATRTLCDYDSSNKTFQSPTLAFEMGTLIKKAIATVTSVETQTPNLLVLYSMKRLIEEEWAKEITKEATESLSLNTSKKPATVPMAEDISKMKEYLDQLIAKAKSSILQNPEDEDAYKKLVEGTYCSLLLFNKRSAGELQHIELDTYLKSQIDTSPEDFDKLLTPVEKILAKTLKQIVIRGKRGQRVPVLFDKVTQEGLDLAIKYRGHFFETFNSYLFGVCHTEMCISGYHVIRKHWKICLGDRNKTTALISTKFRKHLATINQILKMSNDDLEQLATFMGHTTKTYNEWYRLPTDVYQTAKVSKILILGQKKSSKYKGCNLEELDVDDNIIENESADESGKEMDDEINLKTESANINTGNSPKQKKPVRFIRKWLPQEKSATESFFKEHIKNKMAPKKREVLELIGKHPTLFKGRKWDSIKVYVCNQYTKK